MKTIVMTYTVVKTFDFTYEDLCDMDQVKDMTEEQRRAVWEGLVKKTNHAGEIEMERGDDEEAEWYEAEDRISDVVDEVLEEKVDQHTCLSCGREWWTDENDDVVKGKECGHA